LSWYPASLTNHQAAHGLVLDLATKQVLLSLKPTATPGWLHVAVDILPLQALTSKTIVS
jgi:hypothetical protein